jgi:hypothetical protein
MNNIQETAIRLDQFTYILDKINSSDFCEEPFKHIEIFDFLSEEHFNSIITSDQIAFPEVSTPNTLIDNLLSEGYEPIPFPGCTTSVHHYLSWLKAKSGYNNHEVCEGFGIALRLKKPKNNILIDLNNFFNSAIFKKTLEDKFGITRSTSIDSGLQKYLHGYEISPHPDIRKKALTYMLNVNPSSSSEDLDIHTHYLTFKPKKRFIQEFWRHNEDYDRCWVPWEWCNTVKQQRRNSSIIIFSPSYDTLHAIKLNYDHLQTQRTQFYGNLWYKDIPWNLGKPQYDQFVFQCSPEPKTGFESKLKSYLRKLLGPFSR